MTSKWGGKRKNAGRPKKLKEWKRVTVQLENKQIAAVNKMKKRDKFGSLSAALRQVINDYFF